MPLLHGKYISTTLARKRLPELVTRVQDPREWVVLTRHGKPVGAVVSFEDLRRIFDLHDQDAAARRPPPPPGLVRLPKGGFGSPRQAAEQVLKVQMDRKREREVLEAGGLDVVRGGVNCGSAKPTIGPGDRLRISRAEPRVVTLGATASDAGGGSGGEARPYRYHIATYAKNSDTLGLGIVYFRTLSTPARTSRTSCRCKTACLIVCNPYVFDAAHGALDEKE